MSIIWRQHQTFVVGITNSTTIPTLRYSVMCWDHCSDKFTENLKEFVYWSLTSPFVTVMDIWATDRNPEPGDNPLLFLTDSKVFFRCTQPQTVMHTTRHLLNQLGTTGICPHRSNQPTQDSNPGPSDRESQTLCVSPPSEDWKFEGMLQEEITYYISLSGIPSGELIRATDKSNKRLLKKH